MFGESKIKSQLWVIADPLMTRTTNRDAVLLVKNRTTLASTLQLVNIASLIAPICDLLVIFSEFRTGFTPRPLLKKTSNKGSPKFVFGLFFL
jgi:hypothetical protein